MGTSDPAQIRAIQAARAYDQAVSRLEEVLDELTAAPPDEPTTEGNR